MGEENKVPEDKATPQSRPEAGSGAPAVFQSYPSLETGPKLAHLSQEGPPLFPLLRNAELGGTLRGKGRKHRWG